MLYPRKREEKMPHDP
jgi:uncharacterized membrane protein